MIRVTSRRCRGPREHLRIPSGGVAHSLETDQSRLPGRIRSLAGFSRLRFRFAHNDYQHEEIGRPAVTTFKSKADEGASAQARRPLRFRGDDRRSCKAQNFRLGEEALFPKKVTLDGYLGRAEGFGAWLVDWGLRTARHAPRASIRPTSEVRHRDRSRLQPDAGAGPGVEIRAGIPPRHNTTQAQRAPRPRSHQRPARRPRPTSVPI